MDTNNAQVLEMYSNPALVQSRALDDLTERIAGGIPIVDGNNVCSFLMENASANSADIVQAMVNEFESVYSLRAQTAEDLYKHMSDFDYVNLFSSPSKTYLELTFRKDMLVNGAVEYNDYYNKLVIPRDSVFTIEQFEFSIHYPIEIRINKFTDTFVVVYDTSETSPLETLTQNTLEHRVYRIDGVELMSIMIPVHQFSRTLVTEELSQSSAFIKSYTYTDKFYAIRAYTSVGESDAFVEVAQTLSDEIYDPQTATVQIMVDQERKQLKLSIPQVHLTEGLFGTRLKIEILTSKGVVNANISAITHENITTKFTTTGDPELDKYIAPLTRPDLLITRPVSTKIIGGGDGLTFEELRTRVIHNSFYGSVLLSPVDIINYLSDQGFEVEKYRDGITERIYLCSKELKTKKEVIVPAGNIPTEFTTTDLSGISTINDNNDSSYTVYPTTLFKYNKSTGRSMPVSDADVALIGAMTNSELVEEFNNNIYTTCPYHLRIDSSDRYPSAYLYDFNNPKINSLEFIAENTNVATQLTCADVKISHAKAGIGGFAVELYVVKSDDLDDIDISNFKVACVFVSDLGQLIYQEAVYDRTVDDMDVYILSLTTDYDITGSQKIEITSLSGASGPTSHYVDLAPQIKIVFLVDDSVLASGGPTTVGNYIAGIYPTHTPVTEQELNLTLGAYQDELFSRLDVMYSELEYETYLDTEYLMYAVDVYERDGNGDIVYSIGGGGEVILSVLHAAGDQVYRNETVYLSADVIEDYYGATVVDDGVILDASNAATYLDTLQELDIPILVQEAGDIKLDEFGNPIISKERSLVYYVDLLQLDRKLAYSSKAEHAAYYEDIIETLTTYQSVVNELKPQLIEETWAYYVPLRSMGVTSFKVDNLTNTTLDLELSLRLKLHVQQHVIKDIKLMRVLRESVISIVDNTVQSGIISIVDIGNTIKEEAAGLVVSVDVLGINGQQDLQTLVPIDDKVIPSLKTELVLNDAGEITTARDLDIEFVAMSV